MDKPAIEDNADCVTPPARQLAQRVKKSRVPLMTLFGILLSLVFAYVLWALVLANGPSDEYIPWVQPATATVAIILGISGIIASLLWGASQSFATEAESARRLAENAEAPDVNINGANSQVYIYANRKGEGRESSTAQLLEPDSQEAMLTQIYSHGLAQAKLSFFVSIVFAVLGSTVLLSGVALAISHAPSNGGKYGAIVTQTSGAVIDLLAGVFFLQSNRARRDMGSQGVMLRDDSRSDRRLKAASILADNISDERLRNNVRAQMALQLVEVKSKTSDSLGPDESPEDTASDQGDGEPVGSTAP